MDDNTAVMTSSSLPEEVEKAIATGDLSVLSTEHRLVYYREKCRSLGLNPLTQPFQYLTLNGKLVLYAKKDCGEQLRKIHGVSLKVDEPKFERELVLIHVRGRDKDGREDEDYGFAYVGNLKGEALGNAILKAITKGKRRTTLSICGLGDLDETEVDAIPGAVAWSETPQHSPAASEEANGAGAGETATAPGAHPTADQISALVELARSCGADLPAFGDYLRELMQLEAGTKTTKKFLRETMTMAQFDTAWAFHQGLLKDQIAADVPDTFDAEVTREPSLDPDAEAHIAALRDEREEASTVESVAEAPAPEGPGDALTAIIPAEPLPVWLRDEPPPREEVCTGDGKITKQGMAWLEQRANHYTQRLLLEERKRENGPMSYEFYAKTWGEMREGA